MLLLTTVVLNYIVDPYNIYDTKIVDLKKVKIKSKIRLHKIFSVKKIKPASVVLGTSRSESGYNPEHEYFAQPSYNLAISGGSMYENLMNFKLALKQGNLKQVLLVADYRMFNSITQTQIPDFLSYFTKSKFAYILSIDMLKDSLKTMTKQKRGRAYLDNGQRGHDFFLAKVKKEGGHLKMMNKNEKEYYKNYPTDYHYKDTKNSSFKDFEELLKLAHDNDIKLDIIFGPSHIRQWEALDYYLGYKNWLQWKKDIVQITEKMAYTKDKQPYKIYDFATYNDITSEPVPTDEDENMKYYWDSGHYKNELGLMVLDVLNNTAKYKNFGVELNPNNIDSHLRHQKINRHDYINTKEYRASVFGE